MGRKKKIICYIDVLYKGGAQRVMVNLVSEFVNKGYEVILINDHELNESMPKYQVPDGVQVRYLQKTRETNKIKRNLAYFKNLRKIIKNESPDVVLSFMGNPNTRMLLATIGLNCKKVVSVRNDPNREYGFGRIRKVIAKILFMLADGVVFQTPDAAKYFQKSVQKKSEIIPNPVDGKFFEVKRAEVVHDIVTVGRLQPQKNHRLLIDAWHAIKDEFPNDNLIIYGDAELRQPLQKHIDDLGMTQRAFLPGSADDVEVKLSTAKVFVLPSDYEGLPNALMEAMAVGVPSISTDCPCGGPKMLIEHGVSGLLVPCGDIEKMSSFMHNMLSNDEARISMGEIAAERMKMYQSNLIVEKWEKYLM